MNTDLILVLSLLGVCIVMFARGKPRMDVVALLVIMVLPLLGILDISETLAGFSDSSVILIAALFVVGEGLVRTGISFRMGDWLIRKAGNSETRLLVLMMFAVALLGSVMSSTGVVALFIPVALSIASRLKIHPGRLMMPLSFAALISGMLTLVATPPNMIADGALRKAGFEGFSFFSFTPIGLVILVLGIGYMLVARRWLRERNDENAVRSYRRTFNDYIKDYNLAGREHRLRILPDSPLVGLKLQDLKFRAEYHANVIAIETQGRHRREMLPPTSSVELKAGDVLFVDRHDDSPFPHDLCTEARLEVLPLEGSYFTDQSRRMGMAEVGLHPESSLLGKTILENEFRTKYGLNVIGLKRNLATVEGNIMQEKLQTGDILLVIGLWKSIRQMQASAHDFVVLDLPAEADEVAPAMSRAPFALLSLGVMIVLMVTGIVPNVIAALIACLLMGLFRCVDTNSAYRSIHWPSLILIAGMIPFALALERTGGISLAVNWLTEVFGEAGPRVLLGMLFAFTALTGLFVSNTATAVLMAPVAVKLAAQMEVSPLPFVMIVALAASAAFMTPVSSPVNTLVLGPGRYKFGDFVRIGVPFTLVVMLVSVMLVPVLFPFK